jgi:multiple antibiotic resistance protein
MAFFDRTFFKLQKVLYIMSSVISILLVKKFFAGLFATLNPIINVTSYLALTKDHNNQQKKRIAFIATLTVIITLTTCIFLGQAMLDFFGIQFASFRVAAGIAILLTGLRMLLAPAAPQSNEDIDDANTTPSATPPTNIAVVPLAIPLMAGPAAISVAMSMVEDKPGLMDNLALVAVVIFLAMLSWLAMTFSRQLVKVIGVGGIDVASRIMGIVVASIAIEIMYAGVVGLFPSFVS